MSFVVVGNDHDIYNEPVRGKRTRFRGCREAVPCLSFACEHPGHPGDRQTPWCCGHGPDEIDRRGVWCDDCWYTEALSLGVKS